MVRSFIAANFGYYLKDLSTGSRALSAYYFLLESQFWSASEIQKYQLEKLHNLVRFAYDNVPYYHSLFIEEGINPRDIRTMKDLERIPLLTKEIIRRQGSKIVAAGNISKKVFKVKTGGTTGPPIELQKDKFSYAFEWGSYYRWFNWMGIKLGDPVMTLWGTPYVTRTKKGMSIKKYISDMLLNYHSINSFNLNPSKLEDLTRKMNRIKPKLIKGYLSSVLQLAHFIEERNINLTFNPVAVSTTSETLFRNQREYIQSVFKCPVYDQYGCTEITSVAFECDRHSGLHVNSEHVITEVVDNNSAQSLSGRLIVTDLDEYSMPLLRFETGDIATMSDIKCDCGIAHPIISRIEGRIADTITLADGSEVHGVFFTTLMSEMSSKGSYLIERFQVYQELDGEIEFRIENKSHLPESFIKELEKSLKKFFFKVNIVVSEKIPVSSSGKFRYIVSQRKF